MISETPSSGDCAEATSQGAYTVLKGRFRDSSTRLESRTPTGTEPQAPDKVRMEAGRVGGIGNRMSGPAHKVRPLLRLPLVGDARCWWHEQKAFLERR